MDASIPKSVREAMGRQAVKGPHPAADQLNAYAERALTSQEDALVAGHLATCADCREVVFLANSAVEIPVQPVESPAEVESRMGWLRWVMPATAMLALAIGFFVIQRNGVQRFATPQAQEAKTIQESDPSLKDRYANGSAAKTSEAPQPASADSISQKSSATLATAPVSAPKYANESTKKKSLELKTRDGVELQDGRLLAARPPNTSFDTAAIARPMSREEREKVAGGAVGGLTAGALSDANAAKTTQNQQISNAPAANTQNFQNSNLAMSGPSQARTNQLQAAPTFYKAENLPVKDADMTTALQPPPPPPTTAKKPTSLPTETTPLNLEGTFALKSAEMDAEPQKQRNFVSKIAITVWRVSSDGHLERMIHDQWKRALGGVQQTFRAVAYVQNHVWAGGRGPELFHSADGGESWNTLKVKTADAELQGTMQSIKASDDQHIAVIADDGTVWVTANGGRTWTKQ